MNNEVVHQLKDQGLCVFAPIIKPEQEYLKKNKKRGSRKIQNISKIIFTEKHESFLHSFILRRFDTSIPARFWFEA